MKIGKKIYKRRKINTFFAIPILRKLWIKITCWTSFSNCLRALFFLL